MKKILIIICHRRLQLGKKLIAMFFVKCGCLKREGVEENPFGSGSPRLLLYLFQQLGAISAAAVFFFHIKIFDGNAVQLPNCINPAKI